MFRNLMIGMERTSDFVLYGARSFPLSPTPGWHRLLHCKRANNPPRRPSVCPAAAAAAVAATAATAAPFSSQTRVQLAKDRKCRRVPKKQRAGQDTSTVDKDKIQKNCTNKSILFEDKQGSSMYLTPQRRYSCLLPFGPPPFELQSQAHKVQRIRNAG